MFTKEWYKINKHPRGNLGKKFSEETKKKMSKAGKARKMPENWGEIIRQNKLGVPRSEETKRKISKTRKYNYSIGKIKKRLGSNNNLWKGGLMDLRDKIRSSPEYKTWRLSVFNRDNFTCVNCNQIGGYLEAHHIKQFSEIIKKYNIKTLEEALNCKELLNINNGVTLCKPCHKKTDGYLVCKGGQN